MGEDDRPKWTADVPEPEISIDVEDGVYRAELTNYIKKGGQGHPRARSSTHVPERGEEGRR